MSRSHIATATNRIAFQSAGAMPRCAKARRAGNPTDLETLHLKLIRDLSCIWPDRITGTADKLAIKDRAEHIREVLGTVNDYVNAMAADTAAHAPGVPIDPDYVNDMLNYSASDVVAHIGNAADRLRAVRKAVAAAHLVAAE